MLWLLSQEYEVLGVELSPIAVKSFFSENDLEPRITDCGDFQRWEAEGLCIYLGDFFDLSAENLIDCSVIYDRASLIALPLNMRQRYVDHLRGVAHAINQTLLITLEYDQSKMQGPPFSVNKSSVHQMFEEGCDVECLLEENILEKNERFIQKGLTYLMESVYLLNKR
jgi:thiopurine S-methyltransferase